MFAPADIDDRADDAYDRHVAEQLTERSCRNCSQHRASAAGDYLYCGVSQRLLYARPVVWGEVQRNSYAERDQLTSIAARCRNFQLA
jgi:hypothetical protein